MKKMMQRWLGRQANSIFRRIDFIRLMESLAQRQPGADYVKRRGAAPPAFPNQADIARLAVDLAERSLMEKGENFSRQELEAQAEIISCRYDEQLHTMMRAAAFNIISQLFESRDLEHLFLSADSRELAAAQRVRQAKAEGRGVVYLINHSSHWDEFIFNVFLDQNGFSLPLFAAGQNMMITPSLARIFMLGSYVILRSGASRSYLSTLYHYCQALGEQGKDQGIFLEAWSGGARTRDGSLRYPRRLIALQGALAARNDVLVQPVVISYSRVPEDLGMSEGRSLLSWFNGHHIFRELLKKPWAPQENVIAGLKNLYGRTYVGFGRGRLVSELTAERDETASELTVDEYASLYAIKEIARDKKIMTSQVAARALGLLKRYPNLSEAATRVLEEARDYHRLTFGQEPDLEDFFQQHSLEQALEDGLKSLRARRVIGRRPWFSRQGPKIKSPHGLSYYATHGDRRLYSPSARENLVVCGCEPWAFGLVSYLGRRTLGDKKYNNSSLTLYDRDPERMNFLAYERTLESQFPDFKLPKNVFPTHDHTAAFRKATEVIVAVPPQRMEPMLKIIMAEAKELNSLIVASRGFDPQSHRLTMQMAWEAAVASGRPKVNILALCGPFLPSALIGEEGGVWTLAGEPRSGRASEALLFKWGPFKVHISPDPIGVQMAAALADAYGLYSRFMDKRRKTRRQPAEMAAFVREISQEAKNLALALGGQRQTFEADQPGWLPEFIIRSSLSPSPGENWLNGLKGSAAAGEAAAARAALMEQWPSPWASGYFSIHSACLTAKHLGLNLPHLQAADNIFWN